MKSSYGLSPLYGKGVFTTLAFHDGDPLLWEKHWRRITANAGSLGIDLQAHNEENTVARLKREILDAGILTGRARITFFDESPSRIWSTEGEKKTSLSIIVAQRRPIPDNFRLTISPYRINTTSPLAGIKSTNYLEHLLAYEEASRKGSHEAIRLNERGEVASACMANVIWEKDGKLSTPSPKTGCLPGTTREYILEKLECEEVEVGSQELNGADRIFLTSAGLGVVSVAEFNGRTLNISEHPLSTLLPF